MARKSNLKGYALGAGLVMLGAWFHEAILDQLHKYGIATKHK
jgi:hypothetical protein